MQPQPDGRLANFAGGIDPDGRILPMSLETLAGFAQDWTELLPDSMINDGGREP
jgi:hypothetical protein